MVEGFLESRGRSFTDLWPVAPEYRIVDGHVCPLVNGQFIQQGTWTDTNGCRLYLPMARPELPGEFAKAATGRDVDLVEFVRRYGQLGYAQAWRIPEELVGARVLEGGHDETEPRLRGDPLAWCLAHARTVKLVLDLLGRLADDAALRAVTEQLKVRQDNGHEQFEYIAARRGNLSPSRMVLPLMEPRATAYHIIQNVLNANLAGVSRCLFVEWQDDSATQGFTSLFSNRNLLDAVYWHLADAAVGGWVRQCADPRCRSFFVAKNEKVKYCPPPMGYQGVSPCMNRQKQQKHRDEQKRRREEAKRRTTRSRAQRREKTR